MSPYHYILVVLSITLSTIFNGDIYLTEALNGGFSVELIDRDSPKSPFYNSSETQFERMNNAIHRSFERVKHFDPEYSAKYRVLQSPITNTNGQFLMKFSVGTPKFDVVATVDTGSDIVWMQCQPCKKCYKQTDPIFDPSKSKTYKVALCSSKVCGLIKKNGCKKSSLSLKCQYELSYGDGSTSSGDVAEETLTFDTNVRNNPIRVDKIIIGCGHNNQGVFQPQSTGIVGLGNGATSLTSQLGGPIHHKFSYCLSPQRNIPSLLSFGENAVVSGSGTVSTPLLSGSSSIYYYLNLKGMTVAANRRSHCSGVRLKDGGEKIIPNSGVNPLENNDIKG
ncbi:PREDICTED: aspartic proteinase CDR1-like [Lupinus angustifolius]|uniref:aspartic proteinase CDR1-like n=1 Tax=Lupinus angustifolius TaxID=3871 RepID=UPI00092E951D|nr:PREDICTED: aspartic proteinase CDR1-like [Lupinus angustifolius]